MFGLQRFKLRTLDGEHSFLTNVHSILTALGITCPATQDAVKLLLSTGSVRKHQVVAKLQEAQEMLAEAVRLENWREDERVQREMHAVEALRKSQELFMPKKEPALAVVHFASVPALTTQEGGHSRAACGAKEGRLTVVETEITCKDCIAGKAIQKENNLIDPPPPPKVVHYAHKGGAICGAKASLGEPALDLTIAKKNITCKKCLDCPDPDAPPPMTLDQLIVHTALERAKEHTDKTLLGTGSSPPPQGITQKGQWIAVENKGDDGLIKSWSARWSVPDYKNFLANAKTFVPSADGSLTMKDCEQAAKSHADFLNDTKVEPDVACLEYGK